MSLDSTTRKGKIARLPRAIREELNQRMHDGKTAGEILPWLNELAEVKAVLARSFDGEPINDQNLTNWRKGGYYDWCNHQAEADRLQTLAEFSVKLVETTGLKITDGAAAIAAGNILSQLEAEDDPETVDMLIKQLATLRAGDHAVQDGQRKDRKLQLDIEKKKLKEREVLLAEDKFRRLLCEKLLEAATSKDVQAIVQSDKPKSVKLEQIRLLMFGEDDPDESEGLV
jgi:hypothetical protein